MMALRPPRLARLPWLATLLVLAVALDASAQPEPEASPASAAPSEDSGVTLACFTPQLGFASALARNAWYTAVGRAMGQAAGVPVVAKGFARVRDLRAFVARNPRTLLLVNARLASAQGWRPLLQARGAGGRSAPPMVLASREFQRLPQLRGKPLIVTSTGGGERALVAGLVLAGEVAADSYFSAVAVAPDARSAAAAVSLGKAAGTVVYPSVAAAAGLSTLVTTTGVPLPLLAAAGQGLEPELLARLVAGCGAAPGGAEVKGWGGVDAAALSTFRRALQRRGAKHLVPAAQAWAGLRGGPVGDGEGGGLPLEPLAPEVLLEAASRPRPSDFWPRGEAPEASDEDAGGGP